MQQAQLVVRLNKRVKDLMTIYEKTLEQNVKLEKEHDRLTAQLATSDDHMQRASKLNVQYKHELDKLKVDRDQQQNVQHQIKAKLNETMSICREQNNQLATLRRSLQNQRAISMGPAAAAQQQQQHNTASSSSTAAIDTTATVEDADGGDDGDAAAECNRLRAEVKQLEAELQESYDLIDDLEFEVEQIDYLEAENERLREELDILRAIQSNAAIDVAVDVGQPAVQQACELKSCLAVGPSARMQSAQGELAKSTVEDISETDEFTDDDSAEDDAVDGAAKQCTAAVDDAAAAGKPDAPAIMQQQQLRRDMLHRKLESLQQRQSRRSENLTEKFQRSLSVRQHRQ